LRAVSQKAAVFPLLAVLAVLAAPGGAAAAKGRSCSPVQHHGATYSVRVVIGPVGCSRARRIVVHYLRTGDEPLHWGCDRIPTKRRVTLACGNLPGFGATTVVRASRPR
jgi:hypothetical protein